MMNCTTPKDIICGLGISFGGKCDKQLCKFKAVLRRHYSKMIGTQSTMATIGFVGGGTQILTTPKGELIYKPWGVHVKTNEGHKIEKLGGKRIDRLDKENWYTVPIRSHITEFNMDIGDYEVDGNTIEILLPDCCEQGYFMYSRGPQDIRSLSDQICLSETEWEPLQAGLMRMQAEVNRDFDSAKYWEQREYNLIKSIKEDIEQRIPTTIGI